MQRSHLGALGFGVDPVSIASSALMPTVQNWLSNVFGAGNRPYIQDIEAALQLDPSGNSISAHSWAQAGLPDGGGQWFQDWLLANHKNPDGTNMTPAQIAALNPQNAANQQLVQQLADLQTQQAQALQDAHDEEMAALQQQHDDDMAALTAALASIAPQSAPAASSPAYSPAYGGSSTAPAASSSSAPLLIGAGLALLFLLKR